MGFCLEAGNLGLQISLKIATRSSITADNSADELRVKKNLAQSVIDDPTLHSERSSVIIPLLEILPLETFGPQNIFLPRQTSSPGFLPKK